MSPTPFLRWRDDPPSTSRVGLVGRLVAVLLAALLLLAGVSALPAVAGETPDARDRAVMQGVGVSQPVATENLRAQLIAESGVLAPGSDLELALVFDIRPH